MTNDNGRKPEGAPERSPKAVRPAPRHLIVAAARSRRRTGRSWPGLGLRDRAAPDRSCPRTGRSWPALGLRDRERECRRGTARSYHGNGRGGQARNELGPGIGSATSGLSPPACSFSFCCLYRYSEGDPYTSPQTRYRCGSFPRHSHFAVSLSFAICSDADCLCSRCGRAGACSLRRCGRDVRPATRYARHRTGAFARPTIFGPPSSVSAS